MLRLLNQQRQVMPPVTKYKDLKVERVLDYDDRILSFSVPINVMPEDMLLENYIQTENDEYVIKQISINGNYYDITAQLNIDELEGTHWETFTTTEQTIQQAANLALAGTGWTCKCDISKKRSIKKTNVYTWDILKQIVKTYRVEIIIDSLNKNITFVEKRGEDKGVYFSSQINLKSVGKQAQTTDFYTIILPVGKDGLTIESVNNGKKYLENYTYSSKKKTYYWKDERYTVAQNLKEDAEAKLADLATPQVSYSCSIIDLAKAKKNDYNFLEYDLGDTVTIIDSYTNIRIAQRIVKVIEYPESPEQNQCEISNVKLSFEKLAQKYDDTSDTVDNITTDNGTIDGDAIDNIPASKVLQLDEVIANSAKFQQIDTKILNVTDTLNAANARIGTLETTALTAATADIKYAKIGDLTAATARIGTLEANALTAGSAEILSLKANVTDINTLMFGTASGGSLTTEFSNNVVGLIGDAQIKSAQIKDISADKISSGRLYTNLVEIVSQSGNLDISDNTIQIRDNNKTARVQIGKDAAGDYNIYIWDKSGKLMFDPLYGVQADGIKKAIIRNDMISDTANISGKKIDIASLITSINADGSSTLNASKIYVDTDKQTLDVSFKNLSTNVTTAVNTSNAAATTANSAATTANNANSTANTANSNASSALSKANALGANLKTVTDKVTTQGIQLTAIQGNISSKIWQQDITTAVTGLEIGGRNLLPDSRKLTDRWQGNTKVVAGQTDNFGKNNAVKLKGQSTSDSFRLISNVFKEPGYYTISFYAKADKAFKLKVHEGGNIAFGTAELTTSWKRFTFTLNVKDCTSNNRFYFGGGCSWQDTQTGVYIAYPKLEKGTKATDWTPAPEDVDSSIASLEGSTKTLSTQYTSLNQTLTSLSATVNSNTTAITKKVDGSTVTSLQSKVTSLQTDLNGYKTTVTNTYVTKSTLGNYATTSAMNSAINQKANSIAQSVSATYATKSEFNDMQIGGRNYIPMNMSYWERGTISAGTRTDSTTRLRTKSARAIQGGAKYILSKYGTGKILLFFYDYNYKYISSPDWFKTFPKTFTAPANAKYFNAVIAYDNDGTITGTDSIKFKLEKGTKATDWTPAAEDMATKASLELKIDKSDNGKIISMINASADAINLKANRLSWSSTGTSMTKEGNFTCSTGVIGGFTITSTALYNNYNQVGAGICKNTGQTYDYAFYAGVAHTNRGYAPFAVKYDGSIYSVKGSIGCCTINDTALYTATSGICKNTGQTYDYAFYAGAAYASRGYAKYAVTHAGDVYSNGSAYFNGSANFNGVTNANGEFYVNTSRYGKCAAALTDPSQSIKLFYDAGAKNLLFYLNGTIIANLYT